MGVISVPASKSLTLSNKIPNGNIRDKKIIVGWEGKCVYYSYLFFDTSIIPSDVLLLSATLVLFKIDDFFESLTPNFYICPLLKQFSSFTTYENDCPIDLNPTLKKDFLPFTRDVAIEVDITTLFYKWLSNTLVNRGIVIKANYINPHLCQTSFGSAYSRDNTLIPFIRVHFKQGPYLSNITYTATVIPPVNHGVDLTQISNEN